MLSRPVSFPWAEQHHGDSPGTGMSVLASCVRQNAPQFSSWHPTVAKFATSKYPLYHALLFLFFWSSPIIYLVICILPKKILSRS